MTRVIQTAESDEVFDLDLEVIFEARKSDLPLPQAADPTRRCEATATCTWLGSCGFTCGGVTGRPCAC